MCILGAVSLCLLSLAFAPVQPPASPDAAPTFAWEAPAQCPDREQVAARVEALKRETTWGVQAVATVRDEEGVFVLDLDMQSGEAHDRREIRSDNCESLLEAALFSYSLAIEREAEAAAEREREAELAPEPAEDERIPEEPPSIGDEVDAALEGDESVDWLDGTPTEPRKRRSSAVDFTLRVHGGAGQGPLGLGSVPLGATLGIGGPAWRVEFGGGGYVPRQVRLASTPASGADMTAWMARIRGCGVVGLSERWILPLCGQFEGGLTRASGVGVDSPRNPSGPHLTLTGVVGGAWSMTRRVRLWADVQGGLALLRAGFFVDGSSETLFQAPQGAFAAELGIELRFGAV